MGKSALTLLSSLFFLSPNLVLGETIKRYDLVNRNALYYKKHNDIPFTGKVNGRWKGEVRNGNRNSLWESYWSNCQLEYKGHYKDGKRDGLWEHYYENGQLWFKKHYKNGKFLDTKKPSPTN